MRNLLLADWKRMLRDKGFLLGLLFMTVGSVWFAYMLFDTSLRTTDPFYVEDVLFNLFPMIPFVGAAFVSLFLGTEFDDHTVRNKLVVGHTRGQVYWSAYLTCLGGMLLFLAGMLLCSGLAGYLIFRSFLLPPVQLASVLLCSVLVTAVFSAICVLFGMNVHGRAGCVVVLTVFLFGMLLLSSYFEGRLLASEMMYEYAELTVNGMQFGDLIPNPEYVGGLQRTVMEFVYDLLPTGQAIQLNNMDFERVQRWPWLSLGMLAVTTAAGRLLFRKRDIK